VVGGKLFAWVVFQNFGSKPSSGLLVYGTAGVLGSQLAMIAFSLVMLPFGFLARILLTLLVGTTLGLALLAGGIVFGSDDIRRLQDTLFAVPAIVMGIAVPYFLAKLFLHWRMESRWLLESDRTNLTVAGLMSTTALVAVSLSIAQVSNSIPLTTIMVTAAVAMGVGFLVLLPLSAFVSRTARPLLSVSVGIIAIGSVFVTAQQSGIPIRSSLRFWAAVGMAWVLGSFVLSYTLSLLVLKKCGLRLTTKKSTSSTSE
jgi:hypothetical protein